MRKFVFAAILIGILFLGYYYLQAPKSDVEKAKNICIQKCKQALAAGQNLNNGPCLLNPINELPDWVCDVAHWPREAIDNLAENQCSAFREGIAKHFVEVTPNCEFIRSN
jgi:hypothetical protein